MQRMERALSSFEILDTHSWQRTNKKILSAETQGCLFVHLILDTNTKTSCYKTRQSCLFSYWKVFCHVHTFILAVFNKGSHKKWSFLRSNLRFSFSRYLGSCSSSSSGCSSSGVRPLTYLRRSLFMSLSFNFVSTFSLWGWVKFITSFWKFPAVNFCQQKG